MSTARERIARILGGLRKDDDGIYITSFVNVAQATEMRLREEVTTREYGDYLEEVAEHHSIPVMDRETSLFLDAIPTDGIVVDVGGCWGWHWRALMEQRPDVCVMIVDFVKANFIHAARLLAGLLGKRVFLVHGDAQALPFPDGAFVGYWSVQTLQYIPDFARYVSEAHRVLEPGGRFANYSLNRAKFIEFLYALAGRRYHVEGEVPGAFYLARASDRQRQVVKEVFGGPVTDRYTEILFHPQFGIRTGRVRSRIGRVDTRLSGNAKWLGWVARQHSFHALKEIPLRGLHAV